MFPFSGYPEDWFITGLALAIIVIALWAYYEGDKYI